MSEQVPDRSKDENRKVDPSDPTLPANRQCWGSPNGHKWVGHSNPTGIVCTKCGIRGRGR